MPPAPTRIDICGKARISGSSPSSSPCMTLRETCLPCVGRFSGNTICGREKRSPLPPTYTHHVHTTSKSPAHPHSANTQKPSWKPGSCSASKGYPAPSEGHSRVVYLCTLTLGQAHPSIRTGPGSFSPPRQEHPSIP